MRKLNGEGFFLRWLNSYINKSFQGIISYPMSVVGTCGVQRAWVSQLSAGGWPKLHSPCPSSVTSVNRTTLFCRSLYFKPHWNHFFPSVKVSLWKLKTGSSTLLSWKIETDYFQTPHSAWVGDDFSLYGNRNKNKCRNFFTFNISAWILPSNPQKHLLSKACNKSYS